MAGSDPVDERSIRSWPTDIQLTNSILIMYYWAISIVELWLVRIQSTNVRFVHGPLNGLFMGDAIILSYNCRVFDSLIVQSRLGKRLSRQAHTFGSAKDGLAVNDTVVILRPVAKCGCMATVIKDHATLRCCYRLF
jgi:hypothetical protein